MMEEGNFSEVCQMKEDLYNVPVHIIGHNESYVFFKFTPKNQIRVKLALLELITCSMVRVKD